jgi:hypothetical protein
MLIKIKKIALETRKELEKFAEKICIKDSNRQTLKGFCLIGTYLFYKVAKKFNINSVPVYGKYCMLGFTSMNLDNPCDHWWVMCDDIVVDITASQYIIDKIYIGKPKDKYWELNRGFNFENWNYYQTPIPYKKLLKISQKNIVNALLL